VRGPAVIVRKSDDSQTCVTREMHYDQQMCVVHISKDLPLPTTVYGQETGLLYMICDLKLLVFREDFLYRTYDINRICARIGGVENPRLFLNAPPLFFSHDLPEDCRSLTSERELKSLLEKLQKTEQILNNTKSINLDNCAFKSTFASQYEVKDILGSGGSGCVFKALNKYDNCTYAIKRIAVLPENLEEALKEVQAMAQLEHDGIVAYRTTWIEEPPEGWQLKADAEVIKKIKPEHVPLVILHIYTKLLYLHQNEGSEREKLLRFSTF
ncbi:hypothetical protein PMAYCL1PPCAC_21941, partial [Pristionchus mayeri]